MVQDGASNHGNHIDCLALLIRWLQDGNRFPSYERGDSPFIATEFFIVHNLKNILILAETLVGSVEMCMNRDYSDSILSEQTFPDGLGINYRDG